MVDRARWNRWIRLAGVGGVLLLTIAVYAPVRNHAFLNYDDDVYVSHNPGVQDGLTPAALRRTMTEPHEGNYHPLTMVSHMLDVEAYGMNPRGHHLTNLALHLVNVLLLFAWLHRLTGRFWPSLLVAGLFALHPLNVQSVAWVAERKNVLSTAFWLLGLHAYLAYTTRPNGLRYGAVMGCMLAGLASKPMLVTFPLTLMLVDWAELRGWTAIRRPAAAGRSRRFVEKLPLFVLAGTFALATLWAQRASGAMQTAEAYPILERLGNAASGYLWYLEKMFAPLRLSVFYPHPLSGLSPGRLLLGVAVLGTVSFLVLGPGRRVPWCAFGWLWFLVTLVPVIGVVQVGAQAQADRYAYVPLIGAFVCVVWSAVAWISPRPRAIRSVAAVGGVLVLLTLAYRTRFEVAYWKDSMTLFSRAAFVTPNNQIVRGNLGMAHVDAGDLDAALVHFRAAVQAAPGNAPTRMNLANALSMTGRIAEARPHYEAAMQLAPDDARIPFNLALSLLRIGRTNEALPHLQRALEISGDQETRERIERKLRELGYQGE